MNSRYIKGEFKDIKKTKAQKVKMGTAVKGKYSCQMCTKKINPVTHKVKLCPSCFIKNKKDVQAFPEVMDSIK